MGLEAPPLCAESRATGSGQGLQNGFTGPSPPAGGGLEHGAAQQGQGSSKLFSISCPWTLLALKQSPCSFPFGCPPSGQHTQESPGHNQDLFQHFPFSLLGSTVHLPHIRRFKPNGDLFESLFPCRAHPDTAVSTALGSCWAAPEPGQSRTVQLPRTEGGRAAMRELGTVHPLVPPTRVSSGSSQRQAALRVTSLASRVGWQQPGPGTAQAAAAAAAKALGHFSPLSSAGAVCAELLEPSMQKGAF